MRPDAVGKGFHKGWPLSRASLLNCLLHDIIDCQDVIAIDEHGGDTETYAASGKSGCRALFMTRNADRPAIILHHQHHGSLKNTREIQSLIKIALRGSTISTDTHRHCWIARYFRSHGQANGVQHLCANHNLDRQTVYFPGIVFGSKAAKCVDKCGYRKSSYQQRGNLSI